jgi:hypothetical protein
MRPHLPGCHPHHGSRLSATSENDLFITTWHNSIYLLINFPTSYFEFLQNPEPLMSTIMGTQRQPSSYTSVAYNRITTFVDDVVPPEKRRQVYISTSSFATEQPYLFVRLSSSSISNLNHDL